MTGRDRTTISGVTAARVRALGPAIGHDGKDQLPAMTGLRGLAALWVVLFHFRVTLGMSVPLPRLAANVIESGWLAVDLFFVLSGFVITRTYGKLLSDRDRGATSYFLLRRLARLYPVHLVMIGVLFLAAYGGPRLHLTGGGYGALGLRDLMVHLSLMNAAGLASGQTWNTNSWSIGAEWLAYLVFAGSASVLMRCGWKSGLILALALPATLVFCLTNIYPKTFLLTFDGGAVRGIAGFLAGAGVHALARDGRTPSRLLNEGMGIAAILLTILGAAALPRWPWLTLLFPPLILALAWRAAGVTRFLASPPLILVGEVSYSLYMSHGVVLRLLVHLHLVDRVSGLSIAGRVGAIGLVVIAVAFAAVATYALVERPSRRFLYTRLDAWARVWRGGGSGKSRLIHDSRPAVDH